MTWLPLLWELLMCDVDDGGCRCCTYAPCCDKGRPFARTHTGLAWAGCLALYTLMAW